MTKTLMMAMGAAVLLGGAQVASASCVGDAAATRQECLSYSGGNPAAIAECGIEYRDDLAECGRYGGGLVRSVRRPPPRREAPAHMPARPSPARAPARPSSAGPERH